MVKSFLFQLILLLSTIHLLQGQQHSPAFWSDISERSLNAASGFERYIKPTKYRTVSLNLPVLRTLLATAEQENSTTQITLPLPDGKTARFEIWESSVMHPDLQVRYPEIRCYTGRGIDDPQAIIKCDLTPWGFHAMTFSPSAGSFFIDPYFHGDAGIGIVYFKKDYQRRKNENYACLTTSEASDNWEEITQEAPSLHKDEPEAGDCKLRKYRLALACTGEYAAFHGNTKALVLAAYNSSMNRVNGVYEKDLAVTMQLIANTDTLIFLNATTDPYTNNNGGTMLGQNQTTVTQRIGAANYDIGHVFSTGGGGIAGLGVVCNNTSKANGVTGSGAPIGDAFDIDYVAHEMGHQFGGNHCFNNSCGGNINSSTAMEPGSGSTIMGYAGICPPDVQSNSDDYFHAINIQEISAFTNTGTGNGCPVKTVTGNTAPTVGNVPNYTIPKSTPFALTASGSDIDGDVLTYCWEQMDNQSATMPPVSTSTGGPLFRSYDPATSPTRYFPRLPDLISNTNSQWEELPGVARSMNFRVVVRDNHAGAGCTKEDNVTLTVAGTAGPFVVTVPNTNVTWYALEEKLVTWNVTGTDLPPVNCSNVKITLSSDGGYTYPTVLAESVPNNGSALITVPYDVTSTTCRVKVEGAGNVFFDISNTNFTIQGSLVPTFLLSATTNTAEVCAGNNAVFNLKTIALTGFALPVDLSVAGAPAGAQVTVTPNQITPTGPVEVTVSGLTPAMAGSYTLTVTGVSGTITRTQTLLLSVLPGIPTAFASGVSPANGSTGVAVNATLSWHQVQYADNYVVEISTSPSFTQSVITLNTATNSVQTPLLALATPYYWRVKGTNQCGAGGFNNFNAFQTGAEQCNQMYASTNVPVLIDAVGGSANVLSVLNVPVSKFIQDVDISINILHTYIGDLDASLVGPDNDTIRLFDRPGAPAAEFGCSNDNIVATFNDAAVATADGFENICNSTPPAISGIFKSLGLLSSFNGKNAQGVWTLLVNDNYPGEDEGQITSWSLNFCFSGNIPVAQMVTNSPLTVASNATGTVTSTLLAAAVSGTPGQGVFTLTALPVNGILQLNGITMGVGSTFTQDNINAGLVTYTHNGNTAVADQFNFDVLDQNNNGWLNNQIFQIIILQNTLNATVAVTSTISCNSGNNGTITVTTAGGTAPLNYSITGGISQLSNVFDNLSGGTYTIVVTDALGFTQNAGSLTLTAPAAIAVSTAVAFDDLEVAASGGTGVFEYSIDGSNFQSTGTFADLTDGIYTVTVRDANGCTSTTQVAVSVSTLLTTAVQTAGIDCFGQQTGAVTASGVGGFPPYEYSLNGIDFQSANTFEGLVAGTYTVVIRDSNGTTTTTSGVTINQPAAVAGSAAVALNVITVTATGGTGTYTYAINGAIQGTNVFTVLANGNYTINITDAKGCTTIVIATVDVPALTITDVVSGNVSPCNGVIGTATVVVVGGVPPYQYRLDGGMLQSSMSFLNVLPGNHTFEVLDAMNMTVMTSIIVTQPTPVSATANVLGNGVTVAGADGTAPYSYALGGGAAQMSGVFNALANGAYTVVIADVNGCSTTVSFTINYVPPTIITTLTNVSCFGGSDGSVTFTVSGGVAPYSFVQSPAGPWQNIPAGTYNVTVTDAIGTTKVTTALVTEPPTAVAATVEVSFPQTVTVNAVGGTPPYQYSINNGANYQNGKVFTNVTFGSYTVVVKDSKGCTFSIPVIVSGIVEPTSEWGVRLSPNPGYGLFQLEIGVAPTGTMHAEIHDATGRLLRTLLLECNGNAFQTTIDLTDVPAGVYFLRLTHGNDTGVMRLSKM